VSPPSTPSTPLAPQDEPAVSNPASPSAPPAADALPQRHDPYAAIRDPNYRAFALGFACSSTGLQMMQIAVYWDVYQKTHDTLHLGYVGLARALPVLLLALPAGQIIDLVNRKFVLMLTQFAFACCALLLAFSSREGWPVWATYTFVALSGCARVFNGPSRATLLPLLVPRGVFHNAVTWNSGVFQFSAVAGPLIAGAMMDYSKAAWPVYFMTAMGCFVFAISAITLRPRPSERREGARFTLASMLDGARHLYREKTILGAITLDLCAVLVGGATALMPVYAEEILHVGATGLGLLKAAPFIGALLMSVALAHRPPFRRSGLALLWSVAGFGVCTIIFGLSKNFWFSLAALVALGALDTVSVVVRHVLVQVRTPDHLRGRVSSVNSVFIESSNELGAFESGLVAKFFGSVTSVVSGGIGTILIVMGIAWIWPQIRTLGRLDEHAGEPPAPPMPPAPTPIPGK